MNENKKLILASASPRRKDLLQSIGLKFSVIKPEIDESIHDSRFSSDLIETIALKKVMDVRDKIDYAAVIIGSDTVVVMDNQILGKPAGAEDAFNMLKLLSGKKHRVVSAIVVYDTVTGKTVKDSVVSEVVFREVEDNEIRNYIASEEPFDKAGAYAIQGKAGIFVREIHGCYSNIVGISVYKLAEILKNLGISVL